MKFRTFLYLIYLLCCFTVLAPYRSCAQTNADSIDIPQVVITGTKTPMEIERSGKMIYRFDKGDISNNPAITVPDLLEQVPGVFINGNRGNLGSNIDYFVRGVSNQTLVLIDGQPIADPTAIGTGFFDFRQLDPNQIESIEVMKGGLSSLYGSNAAAGIINIELSEPEDEVISAFGQLQGGSYGQFNGQAGISGSLNGFKFYTSYTYNRSDGISAAEETDGASFDNDGFEGSHLLARLGYAFDDRWEIGAFASLDDVHVEYDDGAFLDADNTFDGEQLRLGGSVRYDYNNGGIELSGQLTDISRSFMSAFPFDAEGSLVTSKLIWKQDVGDALKIVSGVDFQSNKTGSENNEASFAMLDPYGSLVWNSPSGFNIHAGGRLNWHSDYGNQFVYNVNPSYLFQLNNSIRLKLLASYSTSFVAPSIFQLNDPFSGNPDLDPEASNTLEGGFSLYVNERLTLNGVYYDKTDQDLIIFIPEFDDAGSFTGGAYQNVEGDTEYRGVEIDLEYELLPTLSLTTQFTKIDFRDASDILRRPDNTLGGGIRWQSMDRLFMHARILRVGQRSDIDFATSTGVTLDPYIVVDLFGGYELMPGLKLTASIRNLLNEEYNAIYGFTTLGINGMLGISWRIEP